MKTFKFSLVLGTRENTDVFFTLDDNIYGIHSKRVNILYLYILGAWFYCDIIWFCWWIFQTGNNNVGISAEWNTSSRPYN